MNTKVNKYLLVLILLGLLFSTLLSAQQKIQISGKIVEKGTYLPIKDVNISIRGTQNGTTSNYNGDFIFEVNPTLDLFIAVSCVGYEKKVFKFKRTDVDIENFLIELEKQDIYTDEVIMKDNSPMWIIKKSYDFDSSDFEKLKYDNLEDALMYLMGREGVWGPNNSLITGLPTKWGGLPDRKDRYKSDAVEITVYVDEQLFLDSDILSELHPYWIQRIIVWEGDEIPNNYPAIISGRNKVIVIYTTDYANKIARNEIQMR